MNARWSSAARQARCTLLVAAGSCVVSSEPAAPQPGTELWHQPAVVAPLLSEGIATDGERAFAYSSNTRIAAVTLATGRVQWTATGDEPLVDDGVPLSGVGHCGGTVVFSSAIYLYGVAAASGARLWRWQTRGGGWSFSYPVCRDGVVYTTLSIGGLNGAVGIDAATGIERWVTYLSDPPGSGPNGFAWGPAVNEDAVVLCTRMFLNPFSGEVVVLDRATGRIRWRAALPTSLSDGAASCASAPAVGARYAYVSPDDGRIHAYDLQSGQIAWTIPAAFPFPARDKRPLAVIGNVLIAGSSRPATFAFDATTGTPLWRDQRADSLSAQITSPFTVGDSLVVGASASGWAFAYVPTTGVRRWVVRKGRALDDRGFWPGGVLTPTLYVAATTNGLIAIRR